ncbi:uncharacterized protein DUF4128 [Pseudoduganella lurida]|uniref:Uncharacterized protein DUF4128 n=1 Tax=Pseudoduganella lurida TaxID=1036180 RepID=A0A562RJ11_9BURK|nr:phage tail terminator-like protein [Pseudoduganella lurida]TWI69058.1 uncharacterized protein DUF4128 [Pseudoduganella lurida]
MSDPRIRAALDTQLMTLPDSPRVAWQNEDFTPTAGQAYLEAWLLPARNQSANIRSTTTVHRGVYQVNVCCPQGDGTGPAETISAQLQALFDPTAPPLEFAGVPVRITRKPDVGQPLDGRPGFFVIPVSISYESIF